MPAAGDTRSSTGVSIFPRPGPRTSPDVTASGVPEDLRFATKTEIARDQISAALDAGVPCRWVLADALYGSDSRLRRMLKGRREPYMLAVRSNYQLRFLDRGGVIHTDPAAIAEDFEADDWTMLPAGEGAKGFRLYDWARVRLTWTCDPDHDRRLLIRRSRRNANDRAYYPTYAPIGIGLTELADAAGLCWTIEESFLPAKDDLGLDH